MRIELKPGVHLNIIETKQFKTTRISIQFIAPLAKATVTQRTLLTSLLETNSADYPTQANVSTFLESLYGASFGIGVAREGQVHRMSATLNLVADKFADATLLPTAFDFIQKLLFRPNVQDGAFDQATFAREQENLMQYLASLDDDRQTQAALALQRLYFAASPDQAVPSFGELDALSQITPASLYQYYQDVIAHDQIEIVVLGDVDEELVTRLAEQLPFGPRETVGSLSFDQPVIDTVQNQVETANVNQAKFNLGYHVEIDDFGPKYFAMLVAESLFGGSPLSMLFTNVREKASLAYYASSQLDALRHFMSVQTGIDADQQPRVLALIAEQRQMIIDGQFDEARIQAIKDGLINARVAGADSPRFLSNQALFHALTPGAPTDLASFTAKVQAVTKAQVQAAAETMQLQATYFLTGANNG